MEKEPCVNEWMEKLPARGELLVKKKEFMKKKIDHLKFFAKKNSTINRRGELFYRKIYFFKERKKRNG